MFILYRKFGEASLAQEFIKQLEENQIDYELDEYVKEVGTLFYNLSETGIQINLHPEDFERANNIVPQDNELNNVEEDYYLYGFSDDELLEILVKPHEWGEIDCVLAPKILIQRGYDIDKLDIERKKEDHIRQLEQPEKESSTLIISGYVMAALGGWIGIAIGWGLVHVKKTLPNGKQVYTYTEEHRRHGKIIYILGTFMLVFYILYILYIIFF